MPGSNTEEFNCNLDLNFILQLQNKRICFVLFLLPQLIFSQSFHTGKDGRTWHHQHYCCWKCGQNLDTPCQH